MLTVESLARQLDRLFARLVARRIEPSLRTPTRDSLQTYLNSLLLADPESFYTPPETTPAIAESLTLVRQRPWYVVYDFHFPSAIASPWPENDIVYGRYFHTKLAPQAPTVIVLHGWLAFSYAWFSTICRKLATAGINSLMIQLPYHMKRRPRQSRFSGEYAINGDLRQAVEMIRQAVADTRSVVSWIKSTPGAQAGLWGVSLGGWIGGLVTVVEPHLDCAILMIPAIRPDDVLWHSELGLPLKKRVAASGITYERLREALRIVTPKYFQPKLPPARILLMEAIVDQVVRSHTVRELWEAWGRPQWRRYRHSHMSIIFSRRALNDGVSFIRNLTR